MKRGTKVSIRRCFLFILSATFLALNIASLVSAASDKIILTSATIEEQSATATVETPTIDSNKVTSGVTFEKADDYAIFDLEIKNNDTLDYTIDAISDNNEIEYLETSYTYDSDIKAGQTAHIHLTLKYKKQLINVEKININDLTLTIKLTRADATPSEVIINPSTIDKLPLYICTLIVSVALLIVFRKQIPAKLKICAIILAAISVGLPAFTYATESHELNIVFANIEMRGEFEYFDVTFTSGADDTVVTKNIRYGSAIGDQLPTAIDIFGHEFVNWTDEDDEVITAETIITAPRNVKANYKLVIMTVNFDANTGEGDMSSQIYNLNTAQNLTANSFTKNKYNFIEWNTSPDGQGDAYTDSQNIEFSEAGEMTLYAQWRSNPATVTAGATFNAKLKHLSGQPYADWTSDGNTTIQAVKKADALPEDFDYSNPDSVIEASNSDFPIYAWYNSDEKTIYLYTPADWIKTGTSLHGLFRGLTKLSDISGVSEWDTSNATSLYDAFYKTGIKNVDAIATTDREWYTSWDVSNVTEMQSTFDHAQSLTDISALATWDTSNLNSAKYLFANASKLSDLTPLAEWNVSNVSDMSYIFAATKVTNVDALATTQRDGYVSWDVSNVTNMACMFNGSTSLTNINGLANWNTSKVSNIAYIFSGDTNLTDISALANWNTSKLNVIDYAFHKTGISNINALANWNMSKVSSMYNAFSENPNLTNINGATNWDLKNVQNMNLAFAESAISDISGAAKWNVSKVTNFRQTFSNNNISSIEALRPTARDGYTSWDISSATNLSYMLAGNPISDISPIAEWNTSNVTDMGYMFASTNAASVETLATTQRDGYKSWDVSKVTYFAYMFSKCSLQNVNGLSNWNTSSAKSLEGMFHSNAQLSDISGLSLWNTSNVTNLWSFLTGTAITNVDALATTQRDGYVSWDTANITSMNSLFSGATQLADISGVALWNTSKVTGIANMFSNTAITNVDALATTQRDGYVSWDTANVTEMGGIFSGTSKLTDISGLAKWNTSKVTSMRRSLEKTGIISTVPLTPTDRGTYTSWDTGNVRDMFELFSGSRNVNDLSGLFNWDVHSVTDKRYMFSNIPASVQRPSWAN